MKYIIILLFFSFDGLCNAQGGEVKLIHPSLPLHPNDQSSNQPNDTFQVIILTVDNITLETKAIKGYFVVDYDVTSFYGEVIQSGSTKYLMANKKELPKNLEVLKHVKIN